MHNQEWEKLAQKYDECRVFIEFADAHEKRFFSWIERKIQKLLLHEDVNKGKENELER